MAAFRSLWLAGAVVVVAAGCGGYAQRLESVRVGAESNLLDEALGAADALVVRAESGRAPHARDLPLLLLERAALHQARGDHRAAIADLTEADALLEVLDLSPDKAGQAAEYLWSGSRSLYRPPVYEKLMVNVLAASSFLALGDNRAAAVEARRIGVLLEFLGGGELHDHPMLGAAAYVAGTAMELAGDATSAAHFYVQAWAAGRPPGLAERLVLASQSNRFATHPAVAEARAALGLAPDALPPVADNEVVVIAFTGMPPFRVAERLPIGVVFAWIRQDAAYALGVQQQAVYDRIMAEGLLSWVNYPTLVAHMRRPGAARLWVGGRPAPLVEIADVESFALAQWEADRPAIALAAITRLITRVLAREAVQAAGEAAGGRGNTAGFLLGLAAQGAMQAADTPDTRTWTLMPARLSVARVAATAGTNTVRLEEGGRAADVSVEVEPGRPGVATLRVF